MEHLCFVPGSMGQGAGSLHLEHACSVATVAGADSIRVLCEPYAERFYLSRGALRVGDEASSIKGRRLSVLRLSLSRPGKG